MPGAVEIVIPVGDPPFVVHVAIVSPRPVEESHRPGAGNLPTLTAVGKRLIEGRLRQTSARLRTLREELRVIDDQLAHLADDAGDLQIRAMVADSPGAGADYRRAQEHADAMSAHREHVLATIAELERRQDRLLDAMPER